MSADKDIDVWLAERGITVQDSRRLARAALEEAGLTRPGKTRLSEPKLPKAEEILAERFYRVCTATECQHAARASGRALLLVDPRSHCEHCGGSNNRRAEAAATVYHDDELDGLIQLEFSEMDAWFEEDEQIYVHPKDPYKVRTPALAHLTTCRFMTHG